MVFDYSNWIKCHMFTCISLFVCFNLSWSIIVNLGALVCSEFRADALYSTTQRQDLGSTLEIFMKATETPSSYKSYRLNKHLKVL